ncbi:MAG: adenylate/guanylate cyclase domain-containing protein [Actinomycetota bacterium]|nr:adenylate/guanylate cyclase domain-containing protein [Actinomycetota bacterium]
MSTARPTTRYVRAGELQIAYQVVGDAPLDVVYVPGWVSHLEAVWDDSRYGTALRKLTRFARVILFDKRGTGLSDRVPVDRLPTLEERMDEIRLVMDEAEIERASLFGSSEGSLLAAVFAASHPDRVSSLILLAGYARFFPDPPDYPFGLIDADVREILIKGLRDTWGENGEFILSMWAPSAAGDPTAVEEINRFCRLSASPAAGAAFLRLASEGDIREVLPSIHVPTLVLHRSGDQVAEIGHGRYLAEHIQDARFAELPGNEHLWWYGDHDAVLDHVQEFLTGTRRLPDPDRVLATVLFVDVVDSTARASELGDQRWRELLERCYGVIRKELEAHRGREVKTLGDGMLATFDGPGRAARCAARTVAAVRGLGLELRTGLHTGEVEIIGEDVGGLAVHIGARVAALAAPGEVLVSSTVKDLVAGSGIEFEDRGSYELKGVPGEWRLFAAVG